MSTTNVLLALAGYATTGGHAALRLTDDSGNKLVYGMYPTEPGFTALVGDTIVVDSRDTTLFTLAEQMYAQHPEQAASWVSIQKTEITVNQYKAIIDFAINFQDRVAGLEVYSAFDQNGINCTGFVKRSLSYAGVPFNESPAINKYTGNAAYWGPATLADAFNGNRDQQYFTVGEDKSDVLVGNSDTANLSGNDGSDILIAGDGNYILDGGRQADRLYGGAGDDWLGYFNPNESAGSLEELNSDGNFYAGGRGQDHIFGSREADIILFVQGDGEDQIVGNGGADVLQYSAEGAGLQVSRNGTALVLSRKLPDGTFDKVTVENWYMDFHTAAMHLSRVDTGKLENGIFTVMGSVSENTLTMRGSFSTWRPVKRHCIIG